MPTDWVSHFLSGQDNRFAERMIEIRFVICIMQE